MSQKEQNLEPFGLEEQCNTDEKGHGNLPCHEVLLTNLDCIHLQPHSHTASQQELTPQSAREKLEGKQKKTDTHRT